MSETKPTQSDLLMRIVQDIAEIKATVKNYAELEARLRKIEGYTILFGIMTAGVTAVIVAVLTKGI